MILRLSHAGRAAARTTVQGKGVGNPWPEGIAKVEEAAAGFLILAALVFAPAWWACAWPSGLAVLNFLLLASLLLVFPTALVRRASLPAPLLAVITFLLILGWVMTLNSHSLFADQAGCFAPIQSPLESCPGSVERDLSRTTMVRLSALFGATLVTALLGRSRRWRTALVGTLVASAAAVVLLGCAQRWTRAGDVYWATGRHPDYFFGPFRNVTSAGEYLNLALPLAAVLAWHQRRANPLRKSAAMGTLALILAGTCISGSKMAPIIALLNTLLLLLLRSRDLHRFFQYRAGLILVPVVGLSFFLIIWGAGIGVTQDRWRRVFHPGGQATLTDRIEVDRIAMAGLPPAGLFGFGPGTFPAIFPALESRFPNPPPGRWLCAHNDYLQTALEWGALGTPAWTIYFFGGLARLVQGSRRREKAPGDRDFASAFLVALVGVGLEALVDFPLQTAPVQVGVAILLGMAWTRRPLEP